MDGNGKPLPVPGMGTAKKVGFLFFPSGKNSGFGQIF